jgi:hypothetical protein
MIEPSIQFEIYNYDSNKVFSRDIPEVLEDKLMANHATKKWASPIVCPK